MRQWWQKGLHFLAPRVSLEDLAAMVQNGFAQVERRLKALEHGQEDIRLRLDQAAYRFELVELQHRVGRIERQIGMTK